MTSTENEADGLVRGPTIGGETNVQMDSNHATAPIAKIPALNKSISTANQDDAVPKEEDDARSLRDTATALHAEASVLVRKLESKPSEKSMQLIQRLRPILDMMLTLEELSYKYPVKKVDDDKYIVIADTINLQDMIDEIKSKLEAAKGQDVEAKVMSSIE